MCDNHRDHHGSCQTTKLMIGLGIEGRALIAQGEAENADALQANTRGRNQLQQSINQHLTECDMADFVGLGSSARDDGEFLQNLARYGEVEYTRRRYQRRLDRWAPAPGNLEDL